MYRHTKETEWEVEGVNSKKLCMQSIWFGSHWAVSPGP